MPTMTTEGTLIARLRAGAGKIKVEMRTARLAWYANYHPDHPFYSPDRNRWSDERVDPPILTALAREIEEAIRYDWPGGHGHVPSHMRVALQGQAVRAIQIRTGERVGAIIDRMRWLPSQGVWVDLAAPEGRALAEQDDARQGEARERAVGEAMQLLVRMRDGEALPTTVQGQAETARQHFRDLVENRRTQARQVAQPIDNFDTLLAWLRECGTTPWPGAYAGPRPRIRHVAASHDAFPARSNEITWPDWPTVEAILALQPWEISGRGVFVGLDSLRIDRHMSILTMEETTRVTHAQYESPTYTFQGSLALGIQDYRIFITGEATYVQSVHREPGTPAQLRIAGITDADLDIDSVYQRRSRYRLDNLRPPVLDR